MILSEKDFKKHGSDGSIKWDNFKNDLKNVKAPAKPTSSEGLKKVDDVQFLLVRVDAALRQNNKDNMELHRGSINNMLQNRQMISALTKELGKLHDRGFIGLTFTVQRDSLGKIKSLTAKKEG